MLESVGVYPLPDLMVAPIGPPERPSGDDNV